MKKLKSIVSLFAVSFTLVSCVNTTPNPENVTVTQDVEKNEKVELTLTKGQVVLEYGQKNVDPMKWVVSGFWKEITLPKVDTLKLGKQELEYSIIGKDESTLSKTMTIEVKDTQKPIFEDDPKTLEVKKDGQVDLTKVVATDKVDGKVDVTIKGDVKTSELGEQTIVVVATDKNNNTSEKSITLKVVENVTANTTEPSDQQEEPNPQDKPQTETVTQPVEPKPTQPVVNQPVTQPKPVVTQPQPKPTPQPDPKPNPVTPTPQPVIRTENITTTETVAFTTSRVNDPNLDKGTEVVSVAGVNGVRTIITQFTYTDGVQTASSIISNSITTQPINQVISVGTKEVIAGSGVWVGGKELAAGQTHSTMVPHSIYENSNAGYDQAVAQGDAIGGTYTEQGFVRQYFVATSRFTDGSIHYVLFVAYR